MLLILVSQLHLLPWPKVLMHYNALNHNYLKELDVNGLELFKEYNQNIC